VNESESTEFCIPVICFEELNLWCKEEVKKENAKVRLIQDIYII